MAFSNRDELPTVDAWEDVPNFTNEDEEAEFWATHGLGGAALESLGTFEDGALPPPRPRCQRRSMSVVGAFVRVVASRVGACGRASRPVLDVNRRRWLRAS